MSSSVFRTDTKRVRHITQRTQAERSQGKHQLLSSSSLHAAKASRRSVARVHHRHTHRRRVSHSERQAGRPTLCKSTGSDAQVHKSAPGQSACNDCTHRLHGTMHATLNTTLARHRANSTWQRLHAIQSGQQCTTLVSARLHTSQTSNACSLPNLTEH